MKKEDFLSYYSGLSNIELLKIIGEKEKYQAEAVEAANNILSERNYSDDELNAAQTEINFHINKKVERQEKINKKISNANEFIDEHFGIRQRSPEKILNLFCIALFLYTLVSSIINFKFVANLFFYQSIKGYFFAILLYGFEFLFIYLLYKRSNWGWAPIVGMQTVVAMQNAHSFIFLYEYYYDEFIFFEPPGLYSLVFALFIHITIIIFLNTKKIREQFSITRKNRIITFIVSGLVFGLLLVLL